MNKNLQIVSVLFGSVLIIGIGFIVDRVGGFDIRTDDITPPITLSVWEPVVRGVSFRIRWEGQELQNTTIRMRLVLEDSVLPLGSAKLSEGVLRTTISCRFPEGDARLEMFDATTSAILATRPLEILPPGHDCVR